MQRTLSKMKIITKYVRDFNRICEAAEKFAAPQASQSCATLGAGVSTGESHLTELPELVQFVATRDLLRQGIPREGHRSNHSGASSSSISQRRLTGGFGTRRALTSGRSVAWSSSSVAAAAAEGGRGGGPAVRPAVRTPNAVSPKKAKD
eukprot:GHVT01006142.1.p1 GENE.GHVT01006142.1~~GHVT01006142.1.p1  ORF type:complete len:149 (-),score=25.78 GHVT01006142.1:319-765(-)